jgi:Raf kinase inhibitor-like YbhB/YbcL family protein
MKRALCWIVVLGCGSSDDRAPDAMTCTVDPPAAFALTSPAFVSCAAIPTADTCRGADSSPQLAWSGAPAGTQSFAIVLTDLSLSPQLVHWVLYDIPASATGVPAGIDKSYAPASVAGAHQTTGFNDQTRGYLGPCPPEKHIYQFALHALDVPALPGATIDTTRAQAVTALGAHTLATATLTATYPL